LKELDITGNVHFSSTFIKIAPYYRNTH
jgi:hypothetical protein